MKMKWKSRRCSRCERLVLVAEFEGTSKVCKKCQGNVTYPVEFIRKQVLMYGSIEKVAKKLELDVSTIKEICGIKDGIKDD